MILKKGLIVRKEWLDKIFDDGKIWEMRSTRTPFRGPVGLVESGTGLIMGSVNIVGCSQNPIPRTVGLIKYHKVEDLSLLERWTYAWHLEGAKRFKEPIPYIHKQGAVVWVKLNNIEI